MNKSELKASLGKIRPSEELIGETLLKVEKQRERQERRAVFPSYSFTMRLAGAVCSFALVFCIGFALARQDFDVPEVRTLGQLDATEAAPDDVAVFSLSDEFEHGWIVVNGSIDSMSFVELSDSDINEGALRRCKVNITADGLIEKSKELEADLNKTSAEFEADIVFYDNDIMNSFYDQSTREMIFRLTPNADGSWSIVEFAPFQK
ncbi:MAG: hypothetical protein E7672_01645 [Ruminococcaceae bacterium]|nr:hypothetical protein [Oscillospiraceae bacterium]